MVALLKSMSPQHRWQYDEVQRVFAFLMLTRHATCPSYLIQMALGDRCRVTENHLLGATLLLPVITKCGCQGRCVGFNHPPRHDLTMQLFDVFDTTVQRAYEQMGKKVVLFPFPMEPFCLQNISWSPATSVEEEANCILCRRSRPDFGREWVGVNLFVLQMTTTQINHGRGHGQGKPGITFVAPPQPTPETDDEAAPGYNGGKTYPRLPK